MNGTLWRRYWAKVATGDGCWIWTAARGADGYGHIRVDGRTVQAHRLIMQWFVGALEPEQCVLHRCDVRACVRPDHLFIGTREDNMRDMVAKGRSQKAKGSQCNGAKLTEAIVVDVLHRLSRGEAHACIAADYGVSKSAIGMISCGQNWTHVALGGAEP